MPIFDNFKFFSLLNYMLSKEESIRYFLMGCIPVRTYLALLPLRLNPRWLRYYSFILFIQAFTFMYLYFFKMRERAFEAGGVAWWGKFRILHGLTYLVAAILAFNKNRLAWIPLIIDVLMGLVLFLNYRFYK